MSKQRIFSKMTIRCEDSVIDSLIFDCSEINFDTLDKNAYVSALIEGIKASVRSLSETYTADSLPDKFNNLLNLSPANLKSSRIQITFKKGIASLNILACSKERLIEGIEELANIRLDGESGIGAYSNPSLNIFIPERAYDYLSDKQPVPARAKKAKINYTEYKAYAVPIAIPAAVAVLAVSGLLAWAGTQGAASMQAGLSALFSSSVGAVSGGAYTLSVVAGLALVVAIAAALYPICRNMKCASADNRPSVLASPAMTDAAANASGSQSDQDSTADVQN